MLTFRDRHFASFLNRHKPEWCVGIGQEKAPHPIGYGAILGATGAKPAL